MMTIVIAFGVLAVVTCAGLILGACMASARVNRNEDWLEERPLRATSNEPVPARQPVRTTHK